MLVVVENTLLTLEDQSNPAVYFPNRNFSGKSCTRADIESRKLRQSSDFRAVDGNIHVEFTWKRPRAAFTCNDWWISWTQLKEQQPPGGFHCEEFGTSQEGLGNDRLNLQRRFLSFENRKKGRIPLMSSITNTSKLLAVLESVIVGYCLFIYIYHD